MERREFLKILSAAGLALPGCLAAVGCAVSTSPGDPATGLSLGYVSGDVTDCSALVWLCAMTDSRVRIDFADNLSWDRSKSTDEIVVAASSDFTAIFKLDGLLPSTRYYYRAQVAGKLPGPIASFITAPAPGDNAKVVFCFSGDTRESYQPFTVMRAVQNQEPDFFLHLGDTIYADRGGTASTLAEFWQKYRANRSDRWSQNCFSTTSVYALWDDHEVADNYLPGHPLASIGRKAFLDYWPIRRSASEPEKIYRSVRWGRAAELFLLDARQYRDRKKGTMLGQRQHDWLCEGLANSNATFKFVATSVPMAGGGVDRWDGYPKERGELLRYISEKKLTGVFFISADLHYAAITKIPKSSGLLDITAGPLAAPVNRVTNGAHRRYEFFMAENFNFAKITIDPELSANQALLEFIDQDNRVFHTRKLIA